MLFLVRLAGELPTKSKPVRSRFQQRLVQNLADALDSAGLSRTIRAGWSRILVESEKPAGEILCRLFGVSSVSPVDLCCGSQLATIVAAGEQYYQSAVQGKRYAVRARREGCHPFRSKDIEVELGRALNRAATVDLDHPDITVNVEVRPEQSYLYSSRREGPGGLPLGTQGKAVVLVSGGFDSAVAAWLIMKRGVVPEYLFCNLAGAAYERSVLSVAKLLADNWSYGTSPLFHAVDFSAVVSDLRQCTQPKYIQVLLKRLMYRAAQSIADQVGAHALVTGESLGQVSSQTLANLHSIDAVARLPVLRPLITWDKQEIVRESKRIGTFALSTHIQEYCALVPRRPATTSQPADMDWLEQELDANILQSALETRKVHRLRELDAHRLVMPYLYTTEIPEESIVLDCRPRHQYEAWHYPGARHMELEDLLNRFERLDKQATYILYCPIGLQSAVAAEKMQRGGYEAYSFKGGTRAIREHAIRHGLEV